MLSVPQLKHLNCDFMVYSPEIDPESQVILMFFQREVPAVSNVTLFLLTAWWAHAKDTTIPAETPSGQVSWSTSKQQSLSATAVNSISPNDLWNQI